MKSVKKVLQILFIAEMVLSAGSVFAEGKKPVFKFRVVTPLAALFIKESVINECL
jgi:hypothetical protein